MLFRVFAMRKGAWLLVFPLLAVMPSVALGQGKTIAPSPTNHPEAPYPASERLGGRESTVVLDITVERDGTVSTAQVHQSGGDAFDDAALRTVRTWKFSPALQAGKPVRARIQASFHFDPPPMEATSAAPPTAALPAEATASSPSARSETAAARPTALDVDVVGHKDRDTGAAAEHHIVIKELGQLPVKNASGRLGLAPGILLSNEGGEGHAEQVFLRGFDTHEGQEIEFTVDGVPINDSGNPHGTGYADTHFILPEVISSMRVLESPFDPAQGNYAVAGSADFHLGLEQRGETAKVTAGSYGTQRLLMLWGPAGMSEGTFAAAEIYTTSGCGQNRAAKRATGIAQYEGRFAEHGTYRITATGYGTDFQSAGPVREDDVRSKAVDFYGTEDARQGGSSSRFSLAGAIENKVGDTELRVQAFAIHRTMRLLENWTGFIEDTQSPLQTLHGQRGDLSDIYFEGTTFGARASSRNTGTLFGFKQSLELGLYARGDITHGTQDRIEAGTSNTLVPYKTSQDFSSQLGDFALYANAELRFLPWLSVRGGLRADLFEFDVLNNCAVQGGIDHPSPSATPDTSCLTQNTSDGSYRQPFERTTTGSPIVMPRGTVVVGPFRSFALSLSAGKGVRSMDPNYVSQGNLTPFISLEAYEGGVAYAHQFDSGISVTAKSVFFSTHVGQDLAFDPNEVTYTLASGATRTGWAGSGRVTGTFFDASANLTFVKGTYDSGTPAGSTSGPGQASQLAGNTAGLLISYVPSIVLRSDNVVFHDLGLTAFGRPLRGVFGVGTSYVGPRALPYGQTSDTLFLWDLVTSLRWRPLELSMTITNLFDTQYHAGEYNYVSYFPHNGLPTTPTLVPARAFTAGSPRQILVSLSGTVGE